MYRLHKIETQFMSARTIIRGIFVGDIEYAVSRDQGDELTFTYASNSGEFVTCDSKTFLNVLLDNKFVGESRGDNDIFVCPYTEIGAMAYDFIKYSRFEWIDESNEILANRLYDNRCAELTNARFRYGDGDDALSLFQGITRDRVKDRFGGYYSDFISNFHASNIVDYILENKNKVMFDTDKHEIMLVRSVWLNGFNHGMSFGKGEDINVNLYDKKVAEPAIFYFKYSDKFLKFLL